MKASVLIEMIQGAIAAVGDLDVETRNSAGDLDDVAAVFSIPCFSRPLQESPVLRLVITTDKDDIPRERRYIS